MYECIICGNVQFNSTECCVCKGAVVTALDEVAAKEQWVTKLQHMGIKLSDQQLERIAKGQCMQHGVLEVVYVS